jgi:hypothetical protein
MPGPELLPDSRARAGTGGIVGPGGRTWIPIFCANCGTEGGKVPEDFCTFAFWLCRNCEHHGTFAHCLTEPDVAFWKRVHGEAAEEQGLTTLDALVLALDDPSSQLAKLLRDMPKGRP